MTKVGGFVEGGLLHELITANVRTFSRLELLTVGPVSFGATASGNLACGTACNVAKHLRVMPGILLVPLGRVARISKAIRRIEPICIGEGASADRRNRLDESKNKF